MLDHLLPIQVKISRSFSHNQVATDLTRSHVGLRYFSQASLIPRTISSQWSPIQVKTFFRILSHNHMATAFTAKIEEHTSELQSRGHLVCRLLLEKTTNSNNNPAHQ